MPPHCPYGFKAGLTSLIASATHPQTWAWALNLSPGLQRPPRKWARDTGRIPASDQAKRPVLEREPNACCRSKIVFIIIGHARTMRYGDGQTTCDV